MEPSRNGLVIQLSSIMRQRSSTRRYPVHLISGTIKNEACRVGWRHKAYAGAHRVVAYPPYKGESGFTPTFLIDAIQISAFLILNLQGQIEGTISPQSHPTINSLRKAGQPVGCPAFTVEIVIKVCCGANSSPPQSLNRAPSALWLCGCMPQPYPGN